LQYLQFLQAEQDFDPVHFLPAEILLEPENPMERIAKRERNSRFFFMFLKFGNYKFKVNIFYNTLLKNPYKYAVNQV
jgi:hypothetical protein